MENTDNISNNDISVQYITHSGDDLLVVNAARVSFDKRSTELTESDIKLIKYLARNNHWTPFGHPQITLRIQAPIFLRTQMFKHKVGLVENEISRRYVDDPPRFYFPREWRERDPNKKQGSKLTGITAQDLAKYKYFNAVEYAATVYNELLKLGVAPEQARMILPQSMLTEWYWTGSLAAYARICTLRMEGTAQRESQELAKMISEIIEPLFPVCWDSIMLGE